MTKLALIGAICLGISGTANAGTLDKIKEAGAVLLEERSEKENGGMYMNKINFDPSRLYVTLGQENLEITEPNGFDMEEPQNVGRIGYYITDDVSVELQLSKTNTAHDFSNGNQAFYTWSDQSIWARKSFMTEEKFKPFARIGLVRTEEYGIQGPIDLRPFGVDEVLPGWDWGSSDRAIGLGVGMEYEVDENFGIRFDTSWWQVARTNNLGEKSFGNEDHVKTGLSIVYGF